MYSAIDSIVSNALSGVTTLTAGSTWTVIYSILWVWFLVLLIGLVVSIVNAVKAFRGKNKR